MQWHKSTQAHAACAHAVTPAFCRLETQRVRAKFAAYSGLVLPAYRPF